MLYESARVTLAADYRIATLTLLGGTESLPLCRATLDDLSSALRVASRNPALDVLVWRGEAPAHLAVERT